jgi:PIN domain nuclease of toxin-antitoxin system
LRLLLDTHALIWFVLGSDRLPEKAAQALQDGSNIAYVSAVTAMEIATKHRVGKLPEGGAILLDYKVQIAKDGFEFMDVTTSHSLLAGSMDIPHKDPFDRLLMAQAILENCLLVSNETLFDSFGVTRLW